MKHACSLCAGIIQTDHEDEAIKFDKSKCFLEITCIELIPVALHIPAKDMKEPRYGTTRSIFSTMKLCFPGRVDAVIVIRVVKISNDSYSSDVLSAFEGAKKFCGPIFADSSPAMIEDKLDIGHEDPVAKHKLNSIMTSDALPTLDVILGELVQTYVKLSKRKMGK